MRTIGSVFGLVASSSVFAGQSPNGDLLGAYQRHLATFQREGSQVTTTSAGNLGVTFDSSGNLTLATATDQFKISTLAYGSGSVRGKLAKATCTISDATSALPQFNISRPGISEWYVNEPSGLHHWMKVAERPANNGGNLWVKLGIAGNPTIKSLDSGSIQVQQGSSVLTYKGLKVWDSAGTMLPARLEVSGSSVSVVVNDAGAQYPVTIDPVWTQEQKIGSPDGAFSDQFGLAVALEGEWAIIGAPGNVSSKGAAYSFTRRTGGSWTFEQKLTASDGVASDKFGTAVSLNNGRAIIGAPGKATNTGAAYIFTRGGNSLYTQDQKITSSDGASNDVFGSAVAIHGDRAIVGASGNLSAQGGAYVFTRGGGGTWTQEAKLLSNVPTANDKFASSVAIEGDHALVGSVINSSSKGAVYAFNRSNLGVWSSAQKLTASDAANSNEFGFSVSISGNLAAVGAPGRTSRKGAAYFFSRVGNVWSQDDKVTASDPANGDQFGQSVCIVGSRAVIGANNKSNGGAAYSFVRAVAGTWSEDEKLVASDQLAGSKFGAWVAMTSQYLIIGSPSASANVGAAYAFGLPSTKTLAVSYPSLISYSGTPGLYGGLTGSGTVTLSAAAPLGGTVVTLSCANTDVTIPATITVPAGSTTGTFTITTLRVTADALPSVSASATDFGSSAGSFRLLTNKVTKIVFGKTSILGGEDSVCRIDLAVPALSNFLVTLTNGNSGALTAPATVTIPAGQRTINITVTGKTIVSDTLVSLTATPSNSTKTDSITVKASPSVGSVTFQNPSILFGTSTTGFVNLVSVAPPGGVTVTLSSDNLAVTVPVSVFIPAGQTSGSFTVQSVGVKATTAEITATLSGVTSAGTVTILRPFLTSVTLDKSTVRGGAENAILTVNLAAVAPAGGVQIMLTSSKPGVASMPASVTVPEGQMSASVTVTTSSVSGSLVVNLSGQYLNDNAKGAKLTVHNAILASITLDKSTVVGGTENATLTATLTLPAPAGGVVVNLKSSKTNVASVPVTVFIPGGATSASVTVTTYPVAAVVDLIGWITGAGTKGAKLTVTN